MGTCMSKDKKGATVAVHTTRASSSSSAASSLSAQHNTLGQEYQRACTSPAKATEKSESLTSTTAARHSYAEDQASKAEVVSTDKHVVEIRLPIASPNKFQASPTSATLASRAMAVMSRHGEEERCTDTAASEDSVDDVEEEEDDEDAGANSAENVRNSSLPLFYSSYLSGASFSRDLAAFSRDIASLSCSPLKRSPSVNGAHDLIAAAIKAAHMSPQGAIAGRSKPQSYAVDMANADESSTKATSTRSRSLPKRFYGMKGGHQYYAGAGGGAVPQHKRSSSRDAMCINSMALSPRLAVRREEASGEFRVGARQAAARRLAAPPSFNRHHPHHQRINKERSHVTNRRSPTLASDTLPFEENRTQLGDGHGIVKGRPALRERPTNCATWADGSRYIEVDSSFKDRKNAVAETTVKEGKHELLQQQQGPAYREVVQPECPTSLYYPENPCLVAENDQSDTFACMHPTMHRVQSLIKALSEMNMEDSLLSEIEESETEVEGELDLIRFAFDARLSPRKELQAQQARNMLLKEAAMDAFARPSFHENNDMHPVGSQERKQPSPGLAALMSMRLPNGETHSSKIREVLKLLSAAESEMGDEQKTLFYNQLRMVLDSIKPQTFANEKNPQGEAKCASSMIAKSAAARANSWPRDMKEQTHIVMHVESTSTQGVNVTTNQEEQLPPQHECLLASSERLSGAQALELCKCEVIGDTLEASENHDDIISIGLLPREDLDADSMLGYRFCLTNEEEGNLVQEAAEAPNADLSESELILKEVYRCVEIAEQPVIQVQTGNDICLAPDDADIDPERVQPTRDLKCLPQQMVEGPASMDAMKELSSCRGVHLEGMGHTASAREEEMLDLHSQPARGDVCLVEDVEEDVHGSPQRSSVHDGEAAVVSTGGTLFMRTGGSGCARSADDVGSDGSFEFRVRSSTASTPLSTPSTPMLSTASTPRHLTCHANSPLTAQALAEIWEAFD